jgi:hypothetical protein
MNPRKKQAVIQGVSRTVKNLERAESKGSMMGLFPCTAH